MKKVLIVLLVFAILLPASSLAIEEKNILGTWVNVVEFDDNDFFINVRHFFPDNTVYSMAKEVKNGQMEISSDHVYTWKIDYGNIVITMTDGTTYVVEYSDKDDVIFGGTFGLRYRKIYSRYTMGW